MYSKIESGGVIGIQAYPVCVEVDMARGLPSFAMVGSLGREVRESRERVAVALKNVGLSLPPSRITVNLSPADMHKDGTAFDLPIAVGILQVMEYFPEASTEGILFLGELGLNGELKKVRGVLPVVQAAVHAGIRECIVPLANAREGAVIPDVTVRGAEHIGQVLEFLQHSGNREERDRILPPTRLEIDRLLAQEEQETCDFSQVNGQQAARRAAEIAAAGFHSLLMTGVPGAGKSMIAKRIPGILPPLSHEESLEVTGIFSVAGLLGERQALVNRRPFWSPHHTITQAALTGGGVNPKPGIISLAHRGVLFLDELPEFDRSAIDSLRQPLEERRVQLARMGSTLSYPADFMLVCAMNPCPCGYYPDRNRCKCTPAQIARYTGRISGPIADRIDLWTELQPVDIAQLQAPGHAESSADIRGRVMAARKMQARRFQGSRYRFNADIEATDLEKYCALGEEESRLLEQLYHKLQLSARVYHRILRVARTIADLEGTERIGAEHLLEAASYRPGTDRNMAE